MENTLAIQIDTQAKFKSNLIFTVTFLARLGNRFKLFSYMMKSFIHQSQKSV